MHGSGSGNGSVKFQGIVLRGCACVCEMHGIRIGRVFNSLPTNDGKCRHGLCELSISLWEFIWGF